MLYFMMVAWEITPGGTLNQSLTYTYNNDFNLSSFTYAGSTTTYTYDNDGLLINAGTFGITHNAGNGLPESVTDNTFNLNRTFNGYGEVKTFNYSISNNSLTLFDLTRNNAARIITKQETIDGLTNNYVYTYDPMGRLLTVTKDAALVEAYKYDANGTRTEEMNIYKNITQKNFTYSDEDHLLTAGSTNYQYDADGFLVTKTNGTDITTHDYSTRGELLSITLPDTTVIEYIHDPLGRRIAKKVNGTVTEKYLWQGLTRLLAVYDGLDNLVMRFKYADGRMPVAMTKNGSTYYLTYDQVGSLRIVADASGNLVKRVDYDSFGNIISDSDPTFEIPFGFAGGLHDRDTGLVRFGYRDYDPDTGRWTAKDPILFAGGDTDLYGYCLNDPVDFMDVDGLWPTSIHNDIIDTAFPNLPSNYRDAIKRGSKYADTFQSGADSYMHAMRNIDANQSKADACNQMNDYIDDHMQKYRDYLKNGQDSDAYFQLGMALHPIMDSTAPPHQGFQLWGNVLNIPISTLISHWRGEGSIGNQQTNQTVNMMRILNSNGL